MKSLVFALILFACYTSSSAEAGPRARCVHLDPDVITNRWLTVHARTQPTVAQAAAQLDLGVDAIDCRGTQMLYGVDSWRVLVDLTKLPPERLADYHWYGTPPAIARILARCTIDEATPTKILTVRSDRPLTLVAAAKLLHLDPAALDCGRGVQSVEVGVYTVRVRA